MAVAGGPNIVEDGLVLALDAANKKSYPGSGTVWSDLSGNSNDGTLTNGPTFSSNNSGIFSFDGANDIVVGPATVNSLSSTTMTISIWTNPNSTTQRNTLLSKWGRSSLGNFSWLLFLNWFSTGKLYFLVGNSAGSGYSTHYNRDFFRCTLNLLRHHCQLIR